MSDFPKFTLTRVVSEPQVIDTPAAREFARRYWAWRDEQKRRLNDLVREPQSDD